MGGFRETMNLERDFAFCLLSRRGIVELLVKMMGMVQQRGRKSVMQKRKRVVAG